MSVEHAWFFTPTDLVGCLYFTFCYGLKLPYHYDLSPLLGDGGGERAGMYFFLIQKLDGKKTHNNSAYEGPKPRVIEV